MKSLILLVLISFASADADYFKTREQFIKNEESHYFGHKIILTPKEEMVNKLLMQEKRKELDDGFHHPEAFPPAINFFLAKPKINKSAVYRFIQKMPKGGALHIHDTGLADVDYVIKNITYREHLLVCKNEDGMQLAFADPPPQDKCWEPLKKWRDNAESVEEFDAWMRSLFTLETDKPIEKYPDINAVWKAFQGIFNLQYTMLTYRPVFEDYFMKALESFYKDNVDYLEMRGTLPVVYDLNGWPLNPIQVLGLLKSLSAQFAENHPDFLGIKYIYAPSRNVDDSTMNEYLEIFKMMHSLHPDFIVGFDLVGQEDTGKPLKEFIQNFEENAEDVKFFFHAGETNWNGMQTDLNLVDAVLLNTTRIGHAFGILKHPEVMNEAKKRGIAVELCPVSHQVLGLISDLRNHPASHLLTSDFPLVVSSDDPGMWGASPLSHDFYEAFMGIASSQADLKVLKQFALNSLVYSSLEAKDKGRAISKFLIKWDRFIEDVYKNGSW